jgi:hypothetical protein
MDGWDQPDQDSRIGHPADEQWDDRYEGGEAQSHTEKSAIQQIGFQIMFEGWIDYFAHWTNRTPSQKHWG